MDDIDQQSNDGFYWIYQKVTFNVRKARFCPSYHNYKYYAVVMKCCPNLYHHVDALVWKQISILIIYLANISETLPAMTNFGMTCVYKVV